MSVAAIYDIHGNLTALEAVLDEIRLAGVSEIVVGGDVIPGPLPHETLARIRDLELPVRFIQGNGEREVLAFKAGIQTGTVPARFRDVMQWAADEVRPDEAQWLASWPATTRLDVPGVGPALFCHATPRNDTEIFTRATSEDKLRPVFAGLDVELVVCGHTHMQFDRTVGSVRVVNAGSVGLPFGEPLACWLLLGPDVTLRRTSYDLSRAAERIRSSSYPQAEQFASQDIQKPRSEADAIEQFKRVELA